MSGITTQLKALIELAVVDDKFDKSEEMMIMALGKANRVPQEDIQKLINEGLSTRHEQEDHDFSTLTFDEKFEYLYNIIQLMKIDREIFLSEIRYCEHIAEKLGFEKKVVSKMSSRIYSDPSITTDREKLKKQVKKYIS